MALDREAYKVLEDIVGAENISDDPGILEVYAYNLVNPQGDEDRHMPKPNAVILPESTEEVQQIVKACNRYDIRCHAFVTGWAPSMHELLGDVLMLDLRRMNRIQEINETANHVVIEPYVTWCQLQAELMKRGYTVPLFGAGSQTSALTDCTTAWGMCSMSLSMGNNRGNLLSVEWVSPSGEILRLGSAGSGAGWFCGDGPGPSLIGSVRGEAGVQNGNGFFTKIGLKICHWPLADISPTGWFPMEGQSPTYIPEMPANRVKAYMFVWPTVHQWKEAQQKLDEAEVMNEFTKASLGNRQSFIVQSNTDYRQIYPAMRARRQGQYAIGIMEADTEEEFEYKQKVIDKILEETGGRESHYFREERMQGLACAMFIRPDGHSRMRYRATSSGVDSSSPYSAKLNDTVMEARAQSTGTYIERRNFVFSDNIYGILRISELWANNIMQVHIVDLVHRNVHSRSSFF